jgi:hypothetical protein
MLIKYLIDKLLISKIKRFLAKRFYNIAHINRQYAKPKIKMTKFVKISLYFLRFYLFFMFGIIIYKFITLLK